MFTLHAVERMKMRGISKSDVLSCIVRPDKVERINEVVRAAMRIDGKVLLVFYKFENESIVVITAFKSSKVRKYIGE